MIRALVPQAATPTSTTPSVAPSGDLSSGSNAQGGGVTGSQSKNKYHKGANKGEKGKGKGRGKDGGQTKPKGPLFGNSWPRQERGTKRQHQLHPSSQIAQVAHEQEETPAYHEELQAVLKMLTTMTLRHEAPLAIHRQDTAFVIFLKTDVPDSLATTTYALGQKWHETKSATPEKLEAPMRAILFQHLVKTVMDRFEKMVGCPSARSKAVGLGWLSEDETQILGVRLDAENHQHVKDPEVTPLSIAVVREALQELVAVSTRPLVVTRYHATRKLAEQYTSPTLTMLLEVGNRTEEADVAWKRLHKLERSAVWVASGAFLRREHMQRSPLAQRLATVTGC